MSGKKSSKQTTTSTPYQQANYQNLLNRADQWLSGGGLDQFYGGSEGFDPVANMTEAQLGALQGLQNTGGAIQGILGQQGLQSLQDTLGAYDPSKTGLSSAIQAANEQAQWDYQTGVAPQIRQGATNAGQYGSTRHGVAEGIATSRLNQAMANNAAQLAFQDQQAYNQNRTNALQNLSAIAQGLGAGSAMQYDAGSLQQQQQQQEILGQLQKWAYENNVDLQELAAYKDLISGDMGGTSVTKGSAGGGGGLGALGAIGGSVLGSFFGPLGTAAGGQLGGLLFGGGTK